MAKPFDIATKQIVDSDPLAWVRFLGLPGESAEVINVDLSSALQADRLIRVHDPDYLQHTEIFSSYKDDWVLRMHPYFSLARYKTKMRVRTVAVLLRPEAEGRLMTGRIKDEEDDFTFQVVRLWQVRPEDILRGPLSLLPLAVAANVSQNDVPLVLGAIRERTQAEAPGMMDAMYAVSTTLLGLTFSAEQVKEHVKGAWNMPEWVLESSIVKEALAQGKVEGKAEGKVEGKAEGKVEGKEELLTLQLEKRFSTLPEAITARLDRLSADQMNDLGVALFSFSSLSDLENWLSEQSDDTA